MKGYMKLFVTLCCTLAKVKLVKPFTRCTQVMIYKGIEKKKMKPNLIMPHSIYFDNIYMLSQHFAKEDFLTRYSTEGSSSDFIKIPIQYPNRNSSTTDHIPYTNLSILAELEREKAKSEANFWWTGTTPRFFIDPIYIEQNSNQQENTIIGEFDDQYIARLEQNHRKLVEDLIGIDGIQTISDLVDLRAEARSENLYEKADNIKRQLHMYSNIEDELFDSTNNANNSSLFRKLPAGYQIEIKDLSRNFGGGSTWKISRTNSVSVLGNNLNVDDDSIMANTVLQMAHAALGMVAFASEKNKQINKKEFQDLIEQVENKLTQNSDVLHELRGRKAADAAFWFALSGVTSPIIFDHLVQISCYELRRFGKRSSCRAKDILHVVERIAASGCKIFCNDSEKEYYRGDADKENEIHFVPLLYEVAAECLEHKLKLSKEGGNTNNNEISSKELNAIISTLKSSFDLHSVRPLLWIWKFSTKQRKQNAFLKQASRHWESRSEIKDENQANNYRSVDNSRSSEIQWDLLFKDPTRPLVVDIGCGMGVSILGLSTLEDSPTSSQENDAAGLNIKWSDCNFLGGDLSRLAIGYADSLSKRWSVSNRVAFCVVSAEEMMKMVVESYPGEVELVMIQFPTPFKLKKDEEEVDNANERMHRQDGMENRKKGNSQLPSNVKNGFMVTADLLSIVHAAVQRSNGKVLLQSNCEDVAVEMKRMACANSNFRSSSVSKPLLDHDNEKNNVNTKIRKRTKDWIRLNKGNIERAEGMSWSAIPLVPRKGATETEVSCMLNGTPIHRSLLEAAN